MYKKLLKFKFTIIYFTLSILLFFLVKVIEFGQIYSIMRYFLTALLFFIFIPILLYQIFKEIKIMYNEKSKEFIFFIIIVLFTILFLFVINSKDSTVINIERLSLSTENVLNIHSIQETTHIDKTSSAVVPAIISNILGINNRLKINYYLFRFFSLIIIILTFLISQKIFKDLFKTSIVIITIFLSIHMRNILITLDYTIGAIFFLVTTFYFIVKFEESLNLSNETIKNRYFNLSLISALLASSYRYEFSLLLIFPLFIYFDIVDLKNGFNRFNRKKLFLFIFLSLFILSSLLFDIRFLDDDYMLGESNENWNILELAKNRIDILTYNYKKGDFNLSENTLSIFYYFNLLFIPIILSFYLKKKTFFEKKYLLFMLIFIFFYSFMWFTGHTGGTRYSGRYYVSILIFEIIIAYYIIHKISLDSNIHLKKVIFLLLLIFALFTSDSINFNPKAQSSQILKDMSTIEFNYSCYNIRKRGGPNYLSIIFGGFKEIFYLKEIKSDNCYYYIFNTKKENNEVKEFFFDCKERVIFQRKYYPDVEIKWLKYKC